MLCLVLLLGVSSLSVSASENKQVQITQQWSISLDGANSISPPTLTFIPNNGETENAEYVNQPGRYFNRALSIYTVNNLDGTPLFYGGKKTTIKFTNVYYSLLVNENTDNMHYIRSPEIVYLVLFYTDGTTETITLTDFVNNINKVSLTAVVEPSKDVSDVSFRFYNFFTDTYFTNVKAYLGETDGDGTGAFHYEQQTEEAGLLSGILGWVKGIADKVTSGFEDVKNGFSNVISSITELPSKIWEFIENGLKNLFIPSEESMVEIKTKWEETLEKKLGAVWQVVDITFGSWGNINASDLSNSIDFPEITIPLPDNAEFSFGGYEVQVVPNGFELIADICKMATGAFSTLLFINGLRNRYDEVMGVEE